MLRRRTTLLAALAAALIAAGCGGSAGKQQVVTALEDFTNVTPAALQKAVRDVRDTAGQQARDLVVASADLRRDADRGELRGAREDYRLARESYGRLEALDALFPAAARRIVRAELGPLATDLYARRRIDAGTRAAAGRLTADARELRARLRTVRIPPREVVLGSVQTVDRMQRVGVSGRLEPASHLDLPVLLANLDGAESVFLAVEDFVKAKNRRLAGKVIDGFDNTNTDVLKLKRGDTLPFFGAVSSTARRRVQDDLDKLRYAMDQVPGVLAEGLVR